MTRTAWLAAAAALIVALGVLAILSTRGREADTPVASVAAAEEAGKDEVERTCTGCHAYPSPELFPRGMWGHEVERAYGFLNKSKFRDSAAPFDRILAYYLNHSAEALPVLSEPDSDRPTSIRFRPRGSGIPGDRRVPGIANVGVFKLAREGRPEILAADMMNGLILRLRPDQPEKGVEILSEDVSNPGHIEVVDLDRDGINDLIVANLGSKIPTEQRLGSVDWLKGREDGGFTPITLLDQLGRVADVQAADFDGDGDTDLVAAVFGRLSIGEILLLENRPVDGRPTFVPRQLDPRRGTIHVPVVDLNHDGRPDFLALISQENEAVVAFLNEGNLQFKPTVVYAAPSPAFGSSGIQPVDMDRDGDLDVLYTNGDTLDADLLRPYHGIQWLENKGTYPFTSHRLASMYGVHRAVAGDLDGDGDNDVVATSFMPGPFYRAQQDRAKLPSILLLEQTSPGRFERHTLETSRADHATCALADLDGDGRLDLITGNLILPDPQSPAPPADWITLHRSRP